MEQTVPQIQPYMKPLKVLMLITKSNWGGAQRYVFDLATGLPKDKYAVEVMAGGEGPLIDKLMVAGIPAHGTLPVGRDVRFGQDIGAFFNLISILRKKRPDVLHVNSSKIGGLGALAGRLSGVKRIIFTAHGWAFNEDRPLFQKLFIRFLYWVTMVLSHQTIAVSEAAAHQVRNWPFLKGKLVVVHNGIGKETGFSRPNARLELCRMDQRVKDAVEGASEGNLIWIGTVAELHHVKGHAYAIRAISECVKSLEQSGSKKKIVYTIISDGEEKDRLQNLIKELKLESNVFLMGRVDKAVQYCKAFDIFLLASISEALGYALIEAGMGAVPVVATDVGGIPEVVEDMVSGVLVQPKNVRELSHALLFMIEHPVERRGYGAALLERVSKLFSLERMIAETEKAYQSI